MKILASIAFFLFVGACTTGQPCTSEITQTQFEHLLNEVADGWSNNDAARAAAVFAPDAIYSEPPDKQLYIGRRSIFDFFGGEDGRENEMTMIWRHISFNSKTHIGAAEFTFVFDGEAVHGMVSIKTENGLIANWREYYYETGLDWQDFQGTNKF